MTNTADLRSIAGHPKLFLEELGYDIDADGDQPGLWIWTAPTDGSDTSFASAEEALEAAWADAVEQTMAIKELTSEQWAALSFEQQQQEIIDALSGDSAPVPEFDQSPNQLSWLARVRKEYPDIGPKEAFRLAESDYLAHDGRLPR